MPSRTPFAVAALAAVIVFLSAGNAAAASRYQVLDRMESFRQYFLDFQQAPDGAIPGDLLAECYGIIILRQYKAGFIVGVKGGDGLIMMHDRNSGEWSPPAFVVSAEGSFGLQIGGQAIDGIFLIMNQAGVDMLLKTRFKIGVDASAAAGPVGRDVAAQVGPGTALLTYSRSKGLYAGASFEGGALLNYDKYNRALYGRDISLREILLDRTAPMPPEALNMVRTLKMYAVRGSVNSVGPIQAEYAPPPAGQGYGQPGYGRQPYGQGYPQGGQPYQQPYQQQYQDPYQQSYQQPYQDPSRQDFQQQYGDPAFQQTYPPQPSITGADYDFYPDNETLAPTYGTAPVIPPAPEPLPSYGGYQPTDMSQAALDAAATQAARDAQLAAEAARNAAMAAEAAAARAAAGRSGGGY